MLSFFPRLTYTCSVLRQIVGLGAGEAFGIARTSTGSVWTWGAGNNGQLCHSSGSLTGLNAGKVPGDTWQNACSSEDYGIYLSNGTAACVWVVCTISPWYLAVPSHPKPTPLVHARSCLKCFACFTCLSQLAMLSSAASATGGRTATSLPPKDGTRGACWLARASSNWRVASPMYVLCDWAQRCSLSAAPPSPKGS